MLYWVPLLLWAGLIFFLSSLPHLRTELGVWDLILRKIFHFCEFGLLALLVFRVLSVQGVLLKNDGWRVILAVAITILYAISDEFHQSFVEGRVGSVLDVVIDSAGAVVAGLILALRLKKALLSNQHSIKKT